MQPVGGLSIGATASTNSATAVRADTELCTSLSRTSSGVSPSVSAKICARWMEISPADRSADANSTARPANAVAYKLGGDVACRAHSARGPCFWRPTAVKPEFRGRLTTIRGCDRRIHGMPFPCRSHHSDGSVTLGCARGLNTPPFWPAARTSNAHYDHSNIIIYTVTIREMRKRSNSK
jgi:hypothetical protein